jgi:hypothetical protein
MRLHIHELAVEISFLGGINMNITRKRMKPRTKDQLEELRTKRWKQKSLEDLMLWLGYKTLSSFASEALRFAASKETTKEDIVTWLEMSKSENETFKTKYLKAILREEKRSGA